MLDFFEINKRAMNGPYCTERDFDMNIFVPKLREVVKKYGIIYQPGTPINEDDDLADRVFQAALDLCVETGVFVTDTSRIIKCTREEFLEALREAPSAPEFGEGADRKTMLGRKPESDAPPWCFVGAGGATVSNEDVSVPSRGGLRAHPPR